MEPHLQLVLPIALSESEWMALLVRLQELPLSEEGMLSLASASAKLTDQYLAGARKLALVEVSTLLQ
jgi:hypothetical protein